jgi:hypothetical protein
MEIAGSLLWSLEPSTGPYPKPDESSPHHTSLTKIHFNIIPHLRLRLPNRLIPSRFPSKILHTCPSHPILLNFIILIILGEEYKLRISHQFIHHWHKNSPRKHPQSTFYVHNIMLYREATSLSILPRVGVNYKTGFWIGWLDLLNLIHWHSSRLQANTALWLFYTLSTSPLHTHKISKSLLVISWRRTYNSLTGTLNHT